MRYCPRSLVVATRPVDCSRRRPFAQVERMRADRVSATGSPNSSMMRPEIDRAARHRDVGVVDRLAFAELDRLARLERTASGRSLTLT